MAASNCLHHTTSVLADSLAAHLQMVCERTFGGLASRHSVVIGGAARLIIDRLSMSDALYHNAEHTALVTLVAQDILRGRRLLFDVSPDSWLHVIVAALAHDIGYVRGVCRDDGNGLYVIDGSGATIEVPRGASDAYLAPYHVERSKIAVRERFREHDVIDGERIARAIELTRFPVPAEEDDPNTTTEAAIVRAADLIGQLGDPLYLRKLNALFHEFAEIGLNDVLGYANPADLADQYPNFFWSKVEPFIGDAVSCLEMTLEGRQWLSNLYAHICVIEHGRRSIGPSQGANRPASR
jgi:hypothetical protein